MVGWAGGPTDTWAHPESSCYPGGPVRHRVLVSAGNNSHNKSAGSICPLLLCRLFKTSTLLGHSHMWSTVGFSLLLLVAALTGHCVGLSATTWSRNQLEKWNACFETVSQSGWWPNSQWSYTQEHIGVESLLFICIHSGEQWNVQHMWLYLIWSCSFALQFHI